MPAPIASENLTLAGALLQVRLRSAERFLTAEVAGSGGVRKVAPLLVAGTEQAAAIDLTALPDGEYDIAVRSGAAEPVRLGGATAAPYTAQGGGARRVARASFPRDDGEPAFAALYVDPRTDTVRLRIAAADDIDAFVANLDAAPPRTDKPLRYSVISPVYNVEKYLDEFFASLTAQTLFFKAHIDLIMVDDGSTDRSARIIKRWQRKFPANITYIHKENGGISSARNAGLAAVANDWFTFIDPDDFVSPDFFARADETIRRRDADGIAAVSCSVVHYFEATRSESDAHPLRHRFQRGERAVPANDLGDDIQITVCGAFWRRDVVAAASLAFDGRIRPGSEDAHFVGRYLMRVPGKALVFQPAGRYFHRRRADQSSLSQTGWMRRESYDDELRFGYLALIADARQTTGGIPRHIQNMLLYCLSWAFRRAVDQPDAVAFLTEAERQTYRNLLAATLAAIDVDTIATFGVNLPLALRAGLLNLFKDADLPVPAVEVTDIDGHGLMRAVFWSRHEHPQATFRLDGGEIAPAFAKARRIDFLDAPLIFEHIRWLPAGSGARLTAVIGGRAARFVAGTRGYADGLPVADIRPALTPTVPAEAVLPPISRDLRRAAATPEAVATFRNAWLFMDRDTEADDSAEYLYRHVRAHAPDINAFYILSRQSPHWPRLAADKFRLIAFNEPDHPIALLNAAHVISSQADHYVVDYLGRAEFGDRLKFRFTFLQHGVTQADFADFFNRTRMDLVAASSVSEHAAFVADGTRYKLTAKEAKLTGLPRHDALLAEPATDGRLLVIMPTWRYALTGRALGAGNARTENPAFFTSEFARRWKALLHAPRLGAIAAAAGCRIVFVPHPNLQHYLPFFELPASITVRTFDDGQPIQRLFRALSLFVTDFSSKAFDAAYLDKPVVYYQFDPEAYFGGGHTGRPGYFDFTRDGFGPVVTDEEAVFAAIEAAAGAGAVAAAAYRARAAATFAFRDGRSSERLLAAIRGL